MTEARNTRANGSHAVALALATAAALFVVLAATLSAPATVAPSFFAAGATGATPAAAAPELQLEALLKVTTVDTERLAASLNLTLSTRDVLPLGSAGSSAGTLLISMGGLTHALPWPVSSGELAVAGTADLTELIGRALSPFDTYALPLTPLKAVLRLCSGDRDSSDAQQQRSGSRQRRRSQQQQKQEQHPRRRQYHAAAAPPTVAAAPPPATAAAADCTLVALPVRLTFDLSAVPGYRATPRLTPGGSSAAATAVQELIITRCTSQRVLRLMAQILQWVVGVALVARWLGTVACRLLLRQVFGGRRRYMV